MFDHVLRELYPAPPPPRLGTAQLTAALYFALALDIIRRFPDGRSFGFFDEVPGVWTGRAA